MGKSNIHFIIETIKWIEQSGTMVASSYRRVEVRFGMHIKIRTEHVTVWSYVLVYLAKKVSITINESRFKERERASENALEV